MRAFFLNVRTLYENAGAPHNMLLRLVIKPNLINDHTIFSLGPPQASLPLQLTLTLLLPTTTK